MNDHHFLKKEMMNQWFFLLINQHSVKEVFLRWAMLPITLSCFISREEENRHFGLEHNLLQTAHDGDGFHCIWQWTLPSCSYSCVYARKNKVINAAKRLNKAYLVPTHFINGMQSSWSLIGLGIPQNSIHYHQIKRFSISIHWVYTNVI